MSEILRSFAEKYSKECTKRRSLGIEPLPLSEADTKIIVACLEKEIPSDVVSDFFKEKPTYEVFKNLLENRVSPGVYPSSRIKASFLADILCGEIKSPYLNHDDALRMLGEMGGGDNVTHLVKVLCSDEDKAGRIKNVLSRLSLISNRDLKNVVEAAKKGSEACKKLLISWAEGEWFGLLPKIESVQHRLVIKLSGEINTDFLSPAQEASTRDDIPLHALKILSTSPHDSNFIERVTQLKRNGDKLLCVGDVVGTGSSRKSASNSLIWWIGETIPQVPNKKRGGILMASKIAPIFFNTMRGCGAIPIRCATGKLDEGQRVSIDLERGIVTDDAEKVLAYFKVEPASILDEARAGGRNNFIIGRKLTIEARDVCAELGLKVGDSAVPLLRPNVHAVGQKYTLAQKLVGNASGVPGVKPGEYCEPKAHLVFSQDTTGKMTQQELQELACTSFVAPTIQSFCHTAAGPKSKDSSMQFELGEYIQSLGGIDLRPGDGVIHTNGNRFLLPYYVGTGGDSHTRFPLGLSFPGGSDLVAFAASQGYFPLDMPESVLARFKGKIQRGITMRDLVNAIPYAAIKIGQLNMEKGDLKINVFSDRVLEVQGLEDICVEDAYKITDASAERSAAGCTFSLNTKRIRDYVENNLRFLKNNLSKRHPAKIINDIIANFEEWLANPIYISGDPDANYAGIVEIDLDNIKEPLLAMPNDPDKIMPLSEAAGTYIDEVFVGSCMVDITDFRAVAAILDGRRLPHRMKMWTVPPDRESYSKLAAEGVLSRLADAGANIHVPGCSLCMGNQAQVALNSFVLSTSTRNFDNRMGQGSRVFLGSAHLAAMTGLLNRIPSKDEYMEIYEQKVAPNEEKIREALIF